MAEVSTEDLRLRHFLLGELAEKEREELEQRVLSEAGIRDKLLMAEDDLIEEYLEGSLKGEEREKFLRQFLSIPHQRDKLMIAKSLRRFARDEANFETEPVETNVLSEGDLGSGPIEISKPELDTVSIESDIDTVRLKPGRFTKPLVVPLHRKLLVYAPIAAVVLVTVIVGAVWYATYRRNETQRKVIERELAELNTFGELNLRPDQISRLIVSPTSTRNVVTSISSSFKGPVLELWLLPRTKQTERYDALLQKVGSQNEVQISNLQLQDRPGGIAIRLRIPTRLLTRGVYRVQLNGLSTDGRVVETDEYSFQIE